MPRFSHTDPSGKASMVNVGGKSVVQRSACAEGFIRLTPETLSLIKKNEITKGDVLSCARIAGIMGGKRCSEIIPLCHPLLIERIAVDFELLPEAVRISAEAYCTGKTGIEMEALTAVSTAALTIWDMCKAVDKNMQIYGITLLSKHKGESPQ